MPVLRSPLLRRREMARMSVCLVCAGLHGRELKTASRSAPAFGSWPRCTLLMVSIVRITRLGAGRTYLLFFTYCSQAQRQEADRVRYQERLLSPRRLYFLEGQVIFQCREHVFREDVILESPDILMCLDFTGYRFLNGLDDVDPLDLYAGCLWEYSSRNVSFEQDRVPAFLGVLEMVESGLKDLHQLGTPDMEGSQAGLPWQMLDWALLWDSAEPLERSQSALWPSWSWSGWKGRVASALSVAAGNLRWHTEQSWILWYCCTKPPRGRPHADGAYLRRISASDPPDQDLVRKTPAAARIQAVLRPSQGPIKEGKISDSVLLEVLKISPHTLVLITLSVGSMVRATSSRRASWRGYHICKQDGTPYGKLWLDAAWTCPVDAQFEFIAICEGRSSSIAGIELTGADALADGGSEGGCDAFHVLMLHYPRHPRLAERLAVGVVLQKALFEEDVTWKQIWMG